MKYFILVYCIFIFFGFAITAKANDYGTATTAHITTELIEEREKILNSKEKQQDKYTI